MSEARGTASGGSAWLRLVGAGLAYVAFGVLAQWHLLLQLGGHVYDQPILGNDSLLHVWTLAWGQHALATDPLRVLDANIFHPYPKTLLYSDHLLGLAVLLAPLRLFTDNVVLVHNLLVVAAPILNGLAMFALVRSLAERDDAAFLAGFLYAFAPLRFIMDLTQVQMLAAWWMPLMLLFGRRTLAYGRIASALATALCVLGQGTSSIYLTAFFAPFFLAAHVAWALEVPPARHGRRWALLLAAECAAGAALLPFALAYREVQTSLGAVRSPVLSALLSLTHLYWNSHALLPWGTMLLCSLLLGLSWRRLAPRVRPALAFYVVLVGCAVLLALGPTPSLPFGWGRIWGPYEALASLPGFTALRAPGRLIHVALLGLAVLAGLGFAAATTGRSRPWASGALTIVTLLAIAECWPPRFPTIPAPPPARLDPVYAWLARQPPAMRIVELPADVWPNRIQTYQYASTLHWRRMLGGNMGIVPPAYPYLASALRDFPAPAVLADLRMLGITHVVVHGSDLLPATRTELETRIAASQRWLKRRWARGRTAVYAIRPGLRATAIALPGVPLSREGWQATATHGADAAALAIDADPRSAWSSWHDLEVNIRTRWYDSTPFLQRYQRFLRTQPTRLIIDLGQERTAGGVAFRLAGSDPFAIPDLAVETSRDGMVWERAPAALRPLPDVRALVDQAPTLPLGVAFPQPLRLRYLRLSAQGLEWRVADVALYGTPES